MTLLNFDQLFHAANSGMLQWTNINLPINEGVDISGTLGTNLIDV